MQPTPDNSTPDPSISSWGLAVRDVFMLLVILIVASVMYSQNATTIRNQAALAEEQLIQRALLERIAQGCASNVHETSTNPASGNVNTNSAAVHLHGGPGSVDVSRAWLTTDQLARIEGVTQDTIRRRIEAGQYEATKDGSSWRIRNPLEAGKDQ